MPQRQPGSEIFIKMVMKRIVFATMYLSLYSPRIEIDKNDTYFSPKFSGADYLQKIQPKIFGGYFYTKISAKKFWELILYKNISRKISGANSVQKFLPKIFWELILYKKIRQKVLRTIFVRKMEPEGFGEILFRKTKARKRLNHNFTPFF
jgi:hypothetical protein